jgi:hypothetical protein
MDCIMRDLAIFDNSGAAITAIVIDDVDINNNELLQIFTDHLKGATYQILAPGEYVTPGQPSTQLISSPFPSWSWDYELHKWKAPVEYPQDENSYDWDESTQSWVVSESTS